MSYVEIEGDLIKYAKEGMFDVIAHGCNCFCNMVSGLAPQMVRAFDCNYFPLEDVGTRGDINKLGQIDYKVYPVLERRNDMPVKKLYVVNAYTQYGANVATKPLDYEALTLCMRKINHQFAGMHVGLPQIGAGLAGGDWETIKLIIQSEFTDCDVTVVIYKP
jgi:O-acetyl-ADP-ribose deacetylase (regulator of RNase III)